MDMDFATLERARELTGRNLEKVRLITDTTQFMEIGPGDILELEGRRYIVRGTEYEGRFGLDAEPKHWVKRAVDWEDGSAKIIKLVFYEEFDLPIGSLKIRCYRSPRKESRILELVKDHPLFMHGLTLFDTAGNPVRVLERIRGHALDKELLAIKGTHEEYFQRHLKGILTRLVDVCEALDHLHNLGERHGDVRRDHIYVDADNGDWRWIDFDYNFDFKESPFGLDLFGLGNILLFAVAQGVPTLHSLDRETPEVLSRLTIGDFSPVIKNRLVNLKVLHPYLPQSLNYVLMHFAASAPVYYERVDELLADLRPALDDLPAGGE